LELVTQLKNDGDGMENARYKDDWAATADTKEHLKGFGSQFCEWEGTITTTTTAMRPPERHPSSSLLLLVLPPLLLLHDYVAIIMTFLRFVCLFSIRGQPPALLQGQYGVRDYYYYYYHYSFYYYHYYYRAGRI